MGQLTFLDICSGIGGFRLGLEAAGHKCIGYCEYDKFARASYEAMHDTEGEWKANDVTKLEPSDIPYADIWTFGFPCFESGTLVMTENGYKAIEEICTNDMVLTHKNRFCPVVKPMKCFAETIYELNIYGVEKLKATAEHPFLVKDGDGTKWVRAADLQKSDLIGVPINPQSELPDWHGITYERRGREYRLDNLPLAIEDFWWLVGCYMADGWYRVSKRKNATDNYRIVISANDEKLDRLKKHVGAMFHYSISRENGLYKVHFVNKELTMFLMQFGKGAMGKRLTKDILNLPVRQLRAFLNGYLETDGCKVGKYYKASTISRELAYGIQACIHKAYERPSALYGTGKKGKHVIQGREVNQNQVYDIVFKQESSNRDGSFFMDGYIWSKFHEKKEIEFNDYVYNMEVKDDNSYTANNLAVHNCQDISIAGKQRGLSGKRSGIYYNIIDLIKGKAEGDKPTYLLVENVKNLLSIHGGFDFAAVLSEMDEAGYDCQWQVLNYKDFEVPQNRERVFIIANLRSRGRREILSVKGTDGAALKQVIGGRQGHRVYDPEGISVTLMANAGSFGGNTGLYFVDQTYNHPKVTEDARSVIARYHAGITNRSTSSGVLEVQAILTPDRLEKRQNGRRMKEDGEPMFTLTGQDRHGVFLCREVDANGNPILRVRDCTKKGYEEAGIGDGISLAYPESASRRGRVKNRYAQTLDCTCQIGTVMKCGRIRRLTPKECFRLQGFSDVLYERAAAVNSETQLYKQAGNAVTTTVAFAVAMMLSESREHDSGFET